MGRLQVPINPHKSIESMLKSPQSPKMLTSTCLLGLSWLFLCSAALPVAVAGSGGNFLRACEEAYESHLTLLSYLDGKSKSIMYTYEPLSKLLKGEYIGDYIWDYYRGY